MPGGNQTDCKKICNRRCGNAESIIESWLIARAAGSHGLIDNYPLFTPEPPMASLQNIENLMTEIGPLLDLQEVLQSTETLTWNLVWDDGLEVVAEYDEEDERVTFATVIGTVPEQGVEALALMFLQFNGLWHQTGGVRIGVEENAFIQLYDLSALNLDASALYTVLNNFTAKARSWTAILAGENTEPAFDGVPQSTIDEMEILRSGIRA